MNSGGAWKRRNACSGRRRSAIRLPILLQLFCWRWVESMICCAMKVVEVREKEESATSGSLLVETGKPHRVELVQQVQSGGRWCEAGEDQFWGSTSSCLGVASTLDDVCASVYGDLPQNSVASMPFYVSPSSDSAPYSFSSLSVGGRAFCVALFCMAQAVGEGSPALAQMRVSFCCNFAVKVVVEI